jgi:hypothetical protein
MTTFTLDTDSNITAFAALEDALNHGIGSTVGTFSSEKELTQLSAAWPITRFVEVWNSFAGVVPFGDLKPVKKFTDRKTAIARIWKAIQVLTPAPARHAAPSAQHLAKDAPKRTKASKDAVTNAARRPREFSKKSIVVELIRRSAGASLQEIQTATGWQAHSVRGFISGALNKKMGLAVASFKRENGERAYRMENR